MAKRITALLCAVACATLLLCSCKPKDNKGEGGSLDGAPTYNTYEDALAAKDYSAAYLMLLQSSTASPEELGKFAVVPVSIAGYESASGNISYAFEYDSKGMLTKYTVVKPNFTEVYEFTYNELGKVTKRAKKSRDSYDLVYEYTYDDKGNMLTKKVIRYGDLSEDWTYTYNDKGLLATEKQIEYSITEDPKETVWTLKYDSNGRLLSRINQKDRGTQYTYYSNGLLKSEYEVSPDSDPYNVYTYTYDDKGRKISQKYSSGDSYSEFTYAYDLKGTQYTLSYDVSEEINYTYVHEFGDDGLISKVNRTTDDGSYRNVTYDEAGNIAVIDWANKDGWIQKYTFSHNEFGMRTFEGYSDSRNQSYTYDVKYEVRYYENGAPSLENPIKDISGDQSIRSYL